MKIEVLKERFTVCKVEDYSAVSYSDKYCFVGKTDEENSLVCPTDSVPKNTTERDDGWRAFRISGVLDFSLIGILAKIAGLLAEHKISIFALSTYNTDYILVKENKFDAALTVLENSGYETER